eukprot:6919284-Alexandrium_andersonii.AAC.1
MCIRDRSNNWPGTVRRGTTSDVVSSVVQHGLGNSRARGGKGANHTRYHFVRPAAAGQQAGRRSGSDAV